jgi:hypothetical protein
MIETKKKLKSFIDIWCTKLVSWMFWDFVRLWCAQTLGASCQVVLHPIKQEHIPLSKLWSNIKFLLGLYN